jgi:hypothetical protein
MTEFAQDFVVAQDLSTCVSAPVSDSESYDEFGFRIEDAVVKAPTASNAVGQFDPLNAASLQLQGTGESWREIVDNQEWTVQHRPNKV